MEARQTPPNGDFVIETLGLHPETVTLEGRVWYTFRAFANKSRMPYSTVVTWTRRRKLDSTELYGCKYVVEKIETKSRT